MLALAVMFWGVHATGPGGYCNEYLALDDACCERCEAPYVLKFLRMSTSEVVSAAELSRRSLKIENIELYALFGLRAATVTVPCFHCVSADMCTDGTAPPGVVDDCVVLSEAAFIEIENYGTI